MLFKHFFSRKNQRFILCIVAFFVVLKVQAQEFPDYRHYYTGTLGDALAIQMDIQVKSNSVSGKYYYESRGIPLSLSGKIDLDGNIMLDEYDDKQRKTGTFSGNLVALQRNFEGTWASPDGKKNLPFKLEKVAEYVYLKAEHGSRIQSSASYPYLLISPALRNVSEELQKNMIDEYHQALREGQQNYVNEPEFFNGWGYGYDCAVVYHSEKLVSLLATIYSYTGGAHGNIGYESSSFWIQDGKAIPLHLANLFLPNSVYLKVLSDYCIKELLKQGADWVVNGNVTSFKEEDLRAFTLSPRGIEFVFAPYAVGPYAQGSHSVTLPYKVVMNIVNSEGPLKRFVASK